MSDSNQSPSTREGVFSADLHGVHFDFLKERIPAWFSQSSDQRQQELGDHELQLPDWYRSATSEQKTALAEQHTRYRETLNQIDDKLGRIKNIFEFAEPLLKAGIKARFKLDLDVRKVFFARKYGFKSRDDLYGVLVFDQQGDQSLQYEYRGISLLEAALANFEPDEEKLLRCNDCHVITDWENYDGDVLPTFAAINSRARPIAPHEFVKLCRALDLGAQYQKHIEEIVQPQDSKAREALEQQLEEHQRQQLAMATEIARGQFTTREGSRQIASGISDDVYQMLKALLTGTRSATLDGRPVTFSRLKIFGIELVGPLLIGPSRSASDRVERLAVYLPNDPSHPLKEYASSAEFMADLRAQLHSSAYRRYFSQFIPVRQQGVFFAQFNTLYQPAGLTAQSDFPLQSRPEKLPMDETSIEGNPWLQLRQRAIEKLYADARAVAVPTDDEDRNARAARLQSYLGAVVSVFNLAAFVIPGLGPIMLAVGAAQMCEEAFEGIEAYEQGEPKEMWAHFASVALNGALVGTGATVLPKIQLSSMVDQLKPVTMANGKQKLWKADMTPYKASVTLPAEATPDESGLYVHEGKKILAIENDHYQVSQDPLSGLYRIQHPTRPEAYAPELVHNGEGTWRHELERPLNWEGVKLMRRLGSVVDGFSDEQLEQIRQVSGVDNGVLRRLHVEGESIPAILLDTIRKFRAYGDAATVAREIREGSLSSRLCTYAASLAVELPGWPTGKAIEVFSDDGLSGPSVKYGNVEAASKNVIRVSRSELMSGKLPERIIASMSEADVKSLLPHYTPGTVEERITTLRKQIEQKAINDRARLTRSLYAEQQPSANPAVAVIQRDFSHLPAAMVQELMAEATPAERATLNADKRVPLRLAEGARRLQQQMRLTRAYEGVYLDDMAETDTETLVLNSLKALPGWIDDIRLEIREGDIEGELRASVGLESASERKVLLRMNDGRYETRNARDEHLHGADDLYASIQHALPDRHRLAIGLPHVGQGAQLKVKVIEHLLAHDQLRPLLNMQPRLQPFFRVPTRLSGERIGYSLSDHPDVGQWAYTVSHRVRDLYPAMPQEMQDELIARAGDRIDTVLTHREREYASLKRTLANWNNALLLDASDEERLSPDFQRQLDARRAISEALQNAWRYSGEWDPDITGGPAGQTIQLREIDLEGQLEELPRLSANFNHVTNVDLSGTGIADADGFLRNFKRLRKLDLSNNELEKMPEPVGAMVHLVELDLSDNEIEFDQQAVTQLSKLTRLYFLNLEGNPLRLSPDIGQMPDLMQVLLAATGINTWPVGIFDQPRPRTLYLDLRANRLDIIPQVEPGSAQAEIVARTLISQEPNAISAENLRRVRDYRRSVGYPPDRDLVLGVGDSKHWTAGLTQEQWTDKQDVWADLEREPGSEAFFNELRKLANSQDAKTTNEAARIDLCRKVWSMVEATAANTALREKLFRMAAAPSTCVDAGAQVFNAMGLEVLIVQAYDLSAERLEPELLILARGKSRLDELGKIAGERVAELLAEGRPFVEFDETGLPRPHYDEQGQLLEDIDEVQIHMIYPTRLAGREHLDLPWQSRELMYGAPDVTEEMITQAYKRVLDKEKGPLLQERLIQQSFWVDYLKRHYAEQFSALYAKAEPLLDLQAAQQAWLDADSEVQKIHWRSEIVRLAKLLGKPDSEIKPGMVMSDAQYYAEMEAIAAREKALLGKLTHEAMQRANL